MPFVVQEIPHYNSPSTFVTLAEVEEEINRCVVLHEIALVHKKRKDFGNDGSPKIDYYKDQDMYWELCLAAARITKYSVKSRCGISI